MGVTQLWAPWRMVFLEDQREKGGCIFCDLPKENEDKKNLIFYRSELVFGILNKYPYNNGHLMVVPNRHVAEITQLEKNEINAIFGVAQKCVKALGKIYRPEGYNLGMNLGISGGAGIREHLHLHVVPRWLGDTNFMPVIAETKCMPEHLTASFDKIHGYFEKANEP